MSNILLNNVSLTYPLYRNSSRSLKRDVLNALLGRKSEVEKQIIKQINALKTISFSLTDGDFLGLIGHNGAGKSTLLKVLAGIYEITEGNIVINGRVSSLLGNSTGMQHEFNAYKNIKLSCLIQGFSKSETQKVIEDVEEFTELGDFLSLPVKTYSAGMYARLAFAISTAIRPDILLLDEIMGTGDARFIAKAVKRLRSLLNTANILVFASHNTSIMEQFCNKLLWLEHGEVKALGEVDRTLEAYLSYSATQYVPAVTVEC